MKYSFQLLYEVYKKNSDELVKAVCEVRENTTINDFLLWEDFINEIKTKLGKKEVINEERIREILKVIDKEDYNKFLQEDLL